MKCGECRYIGIRLYRYDWYLNMPEWYSCDLDSEIIVRKSLKPCTGFKEKE
jgi:hypothetical protein